MSVEYNLAVRYYKDFYTNYSHPFKGENEITLDKVKERQVYYVAEFNNEGKLTKVTKLDLQNCQIQ